MSDSDLQRRNAIAKLLSDWGLVELLDDTIIEDTAPISQIKILPFKEKDEWTLVTKYNIEEKVIFTIDIFGKKYYIYSIGMPNGSCNFKLAEKETNMVTRRYGVRILISL